MSTVLPARLPPIVPQWPIYRLTVEDYLQMVELGTLDEDDSIELLEGFLVPKMPKYPLHDSTIDYLQQYLMRIVPSCLFVRIQNSLITSDSVPEPDLAVVRGNPFDYRVRHPSGQDVELVIEVAESSVRHDRRKGAIYARAGVPEYWIVNLDEWQLEQMTNPQPDGNYGTTQTYHAGDAVRLVLAGTELGQLPLKDLLTPPVA